MRSSALLLALAGCPQKLPTTLGECPDDSTVGWADVEPAFRRCTGCHASTLTGDARNGALEGVDFDGPEAAAQHDFQTWTMISTGQMPPTGEPMPDDEAWLVWEWLSCGGPG